MYKSETENIEIYFICDDRKNMEIVETYYDEIEDKHYWYFNASLSYQKWQQGFHNLEMGDISRMLLTVAASKYILYKLENNEYKNEHEKKRLKKDLKKIEPSLKKIAEETDFL